ncbi:MAG: hypothetical protein ACE5NM_02525 [Sedimentisphaerales bacterium]
MNLDYLNYLKEKKEIVSIVLFGISAALCILILIKVAGFFVASARAEGVVKRAIAQNNTNTKDIESVFAESKAVADKLKKKNLFAPPPPKQQPIKYVQGILGNEVIINGNFYKVGDMVQDAKIVAIAPTKVSIEWDGRQITLSPIDAVSASPAKPGPKRPEVGKEGTGERAEMVVVKSEERPVFGQPDRRGFGLFRPPDRPRFGERIRERFQNMSEAERDRFRREMQERRERLMNMSPEERQRFIAEMRERFGGGPGRGPGRGR